MCDGDVKGLSAAYESMAAAVADRDNNPGWTLSP